MSATFIFTSCHDQVTDIFTSCHDQVKNILTSCRNQVTEQKQQQENEKYNLSPLREFWINQLNSFIEHIEKNNITNLQEICQLISKLRDFVLAKKESYPPPPTLFLCRKISGQTIASKWARHETSQSLTSDMINFLRDLNDSILPSMVNSKVTYFRLNADDTLQDLENQDSNDSTSIDETSIDITKKGASFYDLSALIDSYAL